jgi:hypothetical protein
VATYRARRPLLEAYRFEGDVVDLADFLGMDEPDDLEPADRVIIELPSGEEQLAVGDYIVRDDHGGFEPHPGRHFEWLYIEHDPAVDPPFDDAGDA